MLTKPTFSWSSKGVYNEVNYWLSQVIAEGDHGPQKALIYLCLVVLVSVFFKKSFFVHGRQGIGAHPQLCNEQVAQ